jgi:predicted nucleotidyltransferase
MGTKAITSAHLAETLFSRSRRAVLALLLVRPGEEFFLRQIVRACGGGMGAIQRELQQLVEAGILRRTVRHKQVYFQADAACPIFEELKSIVLKTAGLADVLRAALMALSDRIDVAFVCGSTARRTQNSQSDVDLLLVGDVSFADAVAALHEAQARLSREINPVVYSRAEFSARLREDHPFLRNVVANEKIFLLGDDRGLERLVEERLAD